METTTEKEVLVLLMTRKTAVAAFGALSMVERASSDPEVKDALDEFLNAFKTAQRAT